MGESAARRPGMSAETAQPTILLQKWRPWVKSNVARLVPSSKKAPPWGWRGMLWHHFSGIRIVEQVSSVHKHTHTHTHTGINHVSSKNPRRCGGAKS
jgi:hypothetical protein